MFWKKCIFYLFLLFYLINPVSAFAGSLAIDSISSSTIVISSSHTPSWKATFRNDLGGTLSSLLVPSNSASNIIETTATDNTLYGLGLVVKDKLSAYCDPSATMQLLESSSTRSIIAVSGNLYEFTNGSCTETDDGDFAQTYTIYPDRIIVSGTFTSPSAGSGRSGPYINFAKDNFDNSAFLSDDDSDPVTINSSNSIQTNADISYNPGISVAMTGASTATGTANDYILNAIEIPSFAVSDEFWYQNDTNYDMMGFLSDDSLSGGQSYSYAYVFQITDDNTSDGLQAKKYGQDFWHPENLTNQVDYGSAWNSAIELTDISSNDYFNQYQGLYPFVAKNISLNLTIDGATYNRFLPVFKIREWKRNYKPSYFSVANTLKTIETDYNADFMPFAQAWFYDSTNLWKQIADAGLTSQGDEYLADNADNVAFDQGSYQIFDNSNDIFYLGATSQFSGINSTLGTKGSGSGLVTVWQYCSANLDENTPCDTWSNLTVSETAIGASLFTNSGNIYFTLPQTWKKATVNNSPSLYYIKINKTAGTYSTYPIEQTVYTDVLITQYLNSLDSADQTFNIYHRPTPSLTFTISGVGSNTLTNGITTNIASDYNTLPFGNLSVGAVKYGAHQLTVTNNADFGYSVTMKLVNTLQGNYPLNNIDEFAASGVSWDTPQSWSSPNGSVKNINTGWIGANTSDTRVNGWSDGSAKFGPVSSISHQVMTSSIAETEDKNVYVTYALETNVLQPSDLYAGTIIYNILPIY